MKRTAKKGTFKKVLHYVKQYKLLLVLSILCAAFSVFLTLYVPICIGDAIDYIVEPGKVYFDKITPMLIRIAVSALGVALFTWLQGLINNKITYGVVKNLRNDAFTKLQSLPVSYSDTHPQGETVSRIITDADQFTDGLLMGFSQLFTGILTIVGTLGFMFVIHWKIAIFVVLMTPLSFITTNFIARRTFSFFLKQSEIRGAQTAFINETVGNEKVVKAYGHEKEVRKTFGELNKRFEKCSVKALFFSSMVNPSTRLLNAVLYAGVALIGAFSVMANPTVFTVGSLSVFLSYANQYTKPFNEISGVITEFQNSLACASRVFDLISEQEEMKDGENAVILEKASGDIDIEHVNFSYQKDKELIQDFNLHVKKGQRIAIVGPTGCGKTTFIGLLMRFYDVDSGRIAVDDISISDMTRKSLRKNYGMVLQETWIKTATVKENIAMGKADATDEEIIAAAKASHAHSFIKRLPKGYDTVIGDDYGLSQGQKQLLCIARIMLSLPPMLILDEATSSIDTRTEMKIQQAFTAMMQGRTSFIVAHRLSTVREADIILVMRDGKIVESGTHDALLQQNGFYKKLYESQFQR